MGWKMDVSKKLEAVLSVSDSSEKPGVPSPEPDSSGKLLEGRGLVANSAVPVKGIRPKHLGKLYNFVWEID